MSLTTAAAKKQQDHTALVHLPSTFHMIAVRAKQTVAYTPMKFMLCMLVVFAISFRRFTYLNCATTYPSSK